MKSYTYEELDTLNKDFRKQKGHCIILEGIDGCGKTTIANRIKDEYPEMNYEIIHCGRDTENNSEFFRNIFGEMKNYIFDRAMYGQFVYQTREERSEKGWLSLSDLESLEAIMKTCKFEVIYVSTDLNTCYENCKKDSQDSYYTMDYVKSLDEKFRYMFDTITTYVEPVCLENPYRVSSIINDNRKVDCVNFDYSSLPKIVAIDFDGTLAVGADFPEIGELNERLVDLIYNGKYKDWKKILYTHRTGESLVAACNWCADRGIYFDAVNENIKEVKDALDGGPQHKLWFDVFIDDKAINPNDL